MRAAWLVLAAMACGSSGPHHGPVDARPDVPFVTECNCNPLLQTGCTPAFSKCSWIHEGAGSSPGFIGCAPDGSAAVGEPCHDGAVYSEPGCGSSIADDCVKGAVCVAGVCQRICDNLGGVPMCGSDEACVGQPGLFQYGSDAPFGAGICVPQCDPLVDNDFLGSGVRGSGCAAGAGCYGMPSFGTPPATAFVCESEGSAALVHRSTAGSFDANACAEGYEPIVHASTGSTTFVCVALCVPGDTYLGGPQAPLGIAPHRCATSDARGTFAASEHCVYLWRLEQDGSGNLLSSRYSDTLGVCIDHAQYRYDSNHDGVVDGSDATWPDCATLPLSGSDAVAADFGCVSNAIAPSLPAGPAPGL